MSRWVKSSPYLLLVLGLVSSFLSTLPDGGFVKGFFQGAAIALLVLGVYFLVLTAHQRRDADASMWRPSHDAPHGDGH